jgi:hypothetical protein
LFPGRADASHIRVIFFLQGKRNRKSNPDYRSRVVAVMGIIMRSVLLCLALCIVSPTQVNSSNDIHATRDASPGPKDTVSGESKVEAREVDGQVVGDKPTNGMNLNHPSGSAEPTKDELCRTATLEAGANELPALFFTNLIQQESGFRPEVISPAGAQGIAQFMPRVASSYGLANPFEPVAALKASARLLADLLDQFGNLGLAAAAYNAGPKRVQDWMNNKRKLPAETRHYVHKITGLPAEHWANLRTNGFEVSLPAHARCPGFPPIIAANPTGSALAKRSFVGEREEQSANIARISSGAKQSLFARSLKVRSAQVAGRLSTTPATESSQRRSAVRSRSSDPDSATSRFIATPAPIILVEEKAQSGQRLSVDSKRRPLPRPSQFIVGALVPASIKASETSALAKTKALAQWAKQIGKKKTRIADSDSSARVASSKPKT